MALVSAYSSDEDDAFSAGDVFGLSTLPSAKKPRVDDLVKHQLHAAPDVLSEVYPLPFSTVPEYLIFSTRTLFIKRR